MANFGKGRSGKKFHFNPDSKRRRPDPAPAGSSFFNLKTHRVLRPMGVGRS